ncbi:hypothetical protein [Enterococcus faecalis]|uniref:hypothetical protein n=1 Tax=Enterococcus faecalis TaxID=1351 RepID=UPI00045A59C2|nr:hypothetical protein [Enterococcus faecalis]KAJ85615.1 hypothetical protein P791_1214 [Enterococcus faecalis NY9]
MDQTTKIIVLIGAVIAAASGVGVILGINKLREGLDSDDSRSINRGIMSIVINGAMILASGGMVAYVTGLLNAIQF